MLQSHLFGGRVKLDVIFDFQLKSDFEGLIWQSFVRDFSSLSQLRGLDITKTQLFTNMASSVPIECYQRQLYVL